MHPFHPSTRVTDASTEQRHRDYFPGGSSKAVHQRPSRPSVSTAKVVVRRANPVAGRGALARQRRRRSMRGPLDSFQPSAKSVLVLDWM